MNKISFASLSLLMLAAASCGKAVQTKGPSARADCARPLGWSFTQPQPTVSHRPVDLLFVVDTSKSLSAERSRLATTIPAFVDAISSQADLRVGVMPAHGGASRYSGRLWSPAGTPGVLSLSELGAAGLRDALRKSLAQPPEDADEANGEFLMGSFLRSLEADRVAELRAQGFYREQAALSVVFLTDENDVCFDPPAHGLTAFPDYAPSTLGWEKTARERYCAGVTPEAVVARARARSDRLSWAGIVHRDPDRVPRGGEDAIGHGILELLGSTLDGQALDVTDASYSEGLVRLGDIVQTQLELLLGFDLGGADRVDASTLRVTVDGTEVASSYDPARERIEIPAASAGHAGSLVAISACGL